MERVTSDASARKDAHRRWKLLALGVLLVWLLLVYLLVNIWLLLLFSAVMAALGAWLGPQFILGSATPIHLERFVTLEQSAPRWPDAEGQLDKEIGLTIQKIIQDFVSSWYRRLSPETAFEEEVRGVMWDAAMELKKRLSRSDREELTRKVLILAGCHLQCYRWAKARVAGVAGAPERELLLWDAYQELSPGHPALSGPAEEVRHARRVVQHLLGELVPGPHLETRTGRHLVVELIACNVVLPLVGRMSDPDWLNVVLTNIFSRTPLRLEEEKVGAPAAPAVPKTLPLGLSQEGAPQLLLPSPSDAIEVTECPDPEREESRPQEVANGAEERDGLQYLQPPKPSSPFFLCEESEPESPMSDFLHEPLMNSTEDLLSDLDPLTPAESPGAPLQDESLGAPPEEGCSPRPDILIQSSGLSAELATTPPHDKENPSPIDSSPIITASPTVPIHPFSFVPLSSPDGPVLIQNLRITGTITAREHSGTGSHPYTLYTIKYDTALDSQSLGTLQPMAYHTVNRRYREFLNLQTRLEERADLRKFIKHIKGPKKFLPDLPFGNMDSEKVEARKSLLESFLRQLCASPETAGSEEVQEFLALNTDARIAFVKKPFLVSRIDKIVVNAIVDTLKTAFPRSEPQSPTEELSESEADAKPPGEGRRGAKSRLRFPSSKIAPVLSADDVQERIVYSVGEGGAVSLADLESFIQKQQKLLSALPAPPSRRLGAQRPREAGEEEEEGALSAAALELLWLLMRDEWSWLCTDNVQKAMRLLCGSLIQRWLEVQAAGICCVQRWALYLRLLQQAVWPGGALRTQPRPPRTSEQKEAAREQALQSLMGIIPELLQEVLGGQKCRLVWQSVLDSLQNPQINRHLLYCMWDLILESLST